MRPAFLIWHTSCKRNLDDHVILVGIVGACLFLRARRRATGGTAMSDVPVQVIVAAFQQENGAEDALQDLKEAKKERVIAIENAAVIRRDEKGKLHVKEMRDMGGGKGAAIGGVVGAVVGLLAGPLVLAAGAGALVGG